MIATVTNTISKGLSSKDSPYTSFNWFRSNFNMPVTDIQSGSTWDKYEGRTNLIDQATSYNLSGFSPGFEICVGKAVFVFENDGGSTYNIDTEISVRWTDPSLNTIFWIEEDFRYEESLPAGYWAGFSSSGNTGVAPWEVNSDGVYHFRAGAIGTPNITSVDTSVTFNNVPSVTQLSSGTVGHIWVEGNELAYINANRWKHSMTGDVTGTFAGTSKAGHFWLDGIELHWVGANGYVYKPQWQVQQFASEFSNGPTGTEYAGTSQAGSVWVDSEFGYTHLAYIAENGYKYLTGAGDYPY